MGWASGVVLVIVGVVAALLGAGAASPRNIIIVEEMPDGECSTSLEYIYRANLTVYETQRWAHHVHGLTSFVFYDNY